MFNGELKQTLKLTANMQQSINMLQMSSLELNQFITGELAKNPFLEDGNIVEEKKNVKEHSYDYMANIAAQFTLKDHLTEQINIEINDPIEKLIAFFLLDSLKSNGYKF